MYAIRSYYALLLKTEPAPADDDEEVAEEAEQVLVSAVDSEFGRTTDPVRNNFV